MKFFSKSNICCACLCACVWLVAADDSLLMNERGEEHARRPKQACGDWIVCLHEHRGLELNLVANHQHGIAKSWQLAVHQYKLRAAGNLAFGYGVSICEEWLFGDSVSHWRQVAAPIFLANLILAFLLLWLGKAIGHVTGGPVKFVLRLFAWGFAGILLASCLVLLPLALSNFSLLPFQSQTCKGLFGADAHQEGHARPAWAVPFHRAGTLSNEYYALYSQIGGRNDTGVIASTMLAYTASGILADRMSATCASFTRGGKSKDASLPDFQRWLSRGGFSCQTQVDPINRKKTLYISHPLMTVHRLKLLDKAQTQKIIDAAERYAEKYGWSTDRHKNYATTDLEVNSCPELLQYMEESGLQVALPDAVAKSYSDAKLAAWGLEAREMFVVKYSADCEDSFAGCGQKGLNVHPDGSKLTAVSFNILLNDPYLFKGGGTRLDAYDADAEVERGLAITHASKLRHGGTEVTRGTRYILVGFMEFQSTLTPKIVHSLDRMLKSFQKADFMTEIVDYYFPGGWEKIFLFAFNILKSEPRTLKDAVRELQVGPKARRAALAALEQYNKTWMAAEEVAMAEAAAAKKIAEEKRLQQERDERYARGSNKKREEI